MVNLAGNDRPSKRQRSDIGNVILEATLNASLIHSQEYWFITGDVILQAEHTQFRVHREVLARHSTVFSDTFSVPREADDGEVCPVIELSDKVDDIEYMLSIFYDHSRKHDWAEPMSILHISKLLRTGRKYNIQHFLKEALRRLRAEHPTTLTGWSRCKNPSRYKLIKPGDKACLVDVVSLAEEYGIPSILPAAYLRYIHAYSLKDFLLAGSSVALQSGKARAICVLGRDSFLNELQKQRTSWLEQSFYLPSPGCTGDECGGDQPWLLLEKFKILQQIRGASTINALEPLSDSEVETLCPECAHSIRFQHNLVREAIWSKLPSIFEVGNGWQDLKDFDM